MKGKFIYMLELFKLKRSFIKVAYFNDPNSLNNLPPVNNRND